MGQNVARNKRQAVNEDYCKTLFTMIKSENASSSKFERYLRQNIRREGTTSVATIKEDGLTLLHAVVLHNRLNLLLPLFRFGCWNVLIKQKVEDVCSAAQYIDLTAAQIAKTLNRTAIEREIRELTEWEASLTAAHKAARSGNAKLLMTIQQFEGVDQQQQQQQQLDACGCTVLYWASVSGNLTLVRQLIKRGFDPKCVTSHNETLLHVACQLGYVELIEFLIKQVQIDPLIKDLSGSSAVSKVGELGDTVGLAKLLNCGLSADKVGPALTAAALHGEHKFIHSAIEQHHIDGRLQNELGVSPLTAAVFRSDVQLIKYLFTQLHSFSDVGLRGRNLLHVAAASCSTDIVKLVLEQLKLKHALEQGQLINDKDRYYGAELCCEFHCKDSGQDVWVVAEISRSLMDIFARRVANCADEELTDIKVENYGKILRTGPGLEPTEDLKKDLSDAYKQHVLNVFCADMTPLHVATFSNKTRIAQTLLEFGADPNLQDGFGLSALHLAAMRGNRLLADLLLNHGATVDLVDENNKSAVDIARDNQHPDLVLFLTDVIQTSLNEARRQEYLRHYETDLTVNTERFDCSICFDTIELGHGVVLKECLHMFCRTCLADHIIYADKAEVPCPLKCGGVMLEREIKTIVDDVTYNKHLKLSLMEFEMSTRDAWHCKTVDCVNVLIIDVQLISWFHCDLCGKTNCVPCEAIHEGMTCVDYRKQRDNDTQAKNRHEIDEMIRRQEAMLCPSETCKHVITKTEGCDYIECRCGMAVCWATKGPRWGPKGNGDTSGGCKCGIPAGVRCDPSCRNCH